MQATAAESPELESDLLQQDRRILRIYNFYRILLGGVLLLVFYGSFPLSPGDPTYLRFIGALNPNLYVNAGTLYLLTSVAAAFVIGPQRFGVGVLTFALVSLDILALTMMMHASGGILSGFGNLLLVSIAAGNILLHGRLGLTLAATATLAIFYETFLLSLAVSLTSQVYVQTGLLGLFLFAVALFVQNLSQRLRRTEAVARQRALDIAKLEELNDLIIQRMQTGVVAAAKSGDILLLNESAEQLLGVRRESDATNAALPKPLLERLHQWQRNPTIRGAPIRLGGAGRLIHASFHAVRSEKDPTILIYLEDATRLTQQAQQLKLASLGRLTAGIAHEIRNPLGAISHAAQLLGESEALDAGDLRLASIIQSHSLRMNRIIENVLQLSRRKVAVPGRILVKEWIEGIVAEFPDQEDIAVIVDPADLEVEIDPSQMRQVVTNLVENGLRYSEKRTGHRSLTIRAGIDQNLDLAYLEIMDSGPGVSESQMEKIFEPFYTTEASGTGLGLYISRELCEANHAQLAYVPGTGGACFRITFANLA